jgi:transposase
MTIMKEKEQVINAEGLPVINSKCVGIDVGSKSHFIAIGQKKEDVWEIDCYTEDYHNAAQKIVELGFTSVAMESTGSYWKGLYLILQDYGLEVMLTCGKFTKNVRGRKSDVLDCQWIQKLHSCGILTGSYIPDNFTEAVREISRHRKSMLDNAADYIKKMQKSLRLMNIRLDNTIRDVTGKSGQAIIQAIIKGERNGEKLAELADWRVKKSKEEIAKALTGDWREDLVFELKQSYEIYLLLHKKIEESDKEIERLLKQEIEIQKQQNKTISEYKTVKKKR